MKTLLAILLLAMSPSGFSVENKLPDELLKLILKTPELTAYWHSEREERVPLRMLNKCINKFMDLEMFGENVVVVEAAGDFPYLEIKHCSEDKRLWRVEISYPIEGVVGTFTALMDRSGRWVVVSTEVVEN